MLTSWTSTSIRFGLMGLGILAAQIIRIALHFKNTDGSAFNPLNNFVSELGSHRVSPLASEFNATLVFCSLLIFPLIGTLVSRLDRVFRIAALTTAICCVTGAIVAGVIPIDQLRPHFAAAVLFFSSWLGLAMVSTMGLWRQHSFRHARTFIMTGIIAVLIAAAFLIAIFNTPLKLLKSLFTAPTFQRPPIWDIVVLEWGVIVSFCVWILMAARYLHLHQASCKRLSNDSTPRRGL